MAMTSGKPTGGRKTLAEINITPFTDVCLVLLIIFMVTASFMGGERGLDVKLPAPSTDSQQDARPARDLTLALDTHDVIMLTVSGDKSPEVSQKITFNQLIPALSAVATRYNIKSVTIKPARGVIYRKVVQLMDGVKQAGLTDMSLTAAEPAPVVPTPVAAAS